MQVRKKYFEITRIRKYVLKRGFLATVNVVDYFTA